MSSASLPIFRTMLGNLEQVIRRYVTYVKVVAGVNVPMLWRSLCYADEPLDALVARAVAGATQGVMQVAVSRPQNQAFKPGANDQVHHHHQQ